MNAISHCLFPRMSVDRKWSQYHGSLWNHTALGNVSKVVKMLDGCDMFDIAWSDFQILRCACTDRVNVYLIRLFIAYYEYVASILSPDASEYQRRRSLLAESISYEIDFDADVSSIVKAALGIYYDPDDDVFPFIEETADETTFEPIDEDSRCAEELRARFVSQNKYGTLARCDYDLL